MRSWTETKDTGCLTGLFGLTPDLEAPPRKRVLVIEDEAPLRLIFDRVVHEFERDAEVIGVRSAEAGIKLLGQRPVDLVACDIFLAGRLTGFSVWMYCQRTHPKMPMFMMSSLSVPSFLTWMKNVPEQPPFLPKPFTIDDCRRFVGTYLRR